MAGVKLKHHWTKNKIIAICILIVLPGGGNLHGQIIIIIIKQKIVKSFVLYSVCLFFWCAYYKIFNFAIPHPSDYLNFVFCFFRYFFASSLLYTINSKWSFKSNRKVSFADFSIKIKLYLWNFPYTHKEEKSFTLWVALE